MKNDLFNQTNNLKCDLFSQIDLCMEMFAVSKDNYE